MWCVAERRGGEAEREELPDIVVACRLMKSEHGGDRAGVLMEREPARKLELQDRPVEGTHGSLILYERESLRESVDRDERRFERTPPSPRLRGFILFLRYHPLAARA